MTDFAKEMQDRWTAAEEGDKDNRKEMLEDLKFEGFEQWHPTVRQQRENRGDLGPLPCLINNTIVAFVNQVVGDRLANATSIKILPREDGDKKVAEVRSELIRSIELQSKVQRVYMQSFRPQVSCGLGNFRVDLDYAYEDAFDRDLFIRSIPNPLAVLWDPMAGDPTGKDAEYCFVADRIRKEDYEARFGEKASDFLNDTTTGGTDWVDNETVRLAELWQMTEKDKTVAMQVDGTVIDITGKNPGDFQLAMNPATGQPYIRETKCKYATRTLTNGKEPLEEGFELKIPRVPIIRCMGQEIWIGDKRVRFGLTRLMRDNKRLDNYMLSVAAEKLMSAPRHSYIAGAKQIAGREKDWPNTLTYNDTAGGQPPQETTQNNLQSLLAMSEVFSQNMKEVSGIYEANLGSRSNETSGVAIRARQTQGDIATIVYHENMNAAMQEAGEVLNALIPVVYDTARTIRTVGEDDAVKLVRVNDPNHEDSIDLVTGRYDVSVSTGPQYATKRIEGAAQLSELAARNPKLIDIAGDIILGSMDLPHGDELVARFKKTLPPELQDEDEQDLTPEEKAQRQQKAMEAEALAKHMADLQRREAEAKVAEAEAKARKAVKEAADAEAGLNKQTVDAKNAETNQIKAITGKGFPLPPSAVAMLTPLVAKTIMDALSSPDALPIELHAEIAEEAYDQAEDARVRSAMPPDPINGETAGEQV